MESAETISPPSLFAISIGDDRRDRPAVRAVSYLAGDDLVRYPLELGAGTVPAGLDGGLAGDGVQELVFQSGRIRESEGGDLPDYLHKSVFCVRGVYILGDGSYDVLLLAEGLDLEAAGGYQLRVRLENVGLLAPELQRDGGEQQLGHDLAAPGFQSVEVHALVGSVLVYKYKLFVFFYDYVSVHRLAYKAPAALEGGGNKRFFLLTGSGNRKRVRF